MFLAHPCDPCCLCDNADFSDDFSTTKSEWEVFSGTFTVTGGRLRCTAVAGTLNAFDRVCRGVPDLDGVVISISSKLYTTGNQSTIGISLRNEGNAVIVRLVGVNSGTFSKRIGTASATTFGPSFSTGDTVTIELIDVSSGAGTYDVKWYVNGNLESTDSSVAISLPDELYVTAEVAVFSAGSNNGEWDDVAYAVTYP